MAKEIQEILNEVLCDNSLCVIWNNDLPDYSAKFRYASQYSTGITKFKTQISAMNDLEKLWSTTSTRKAIKSNSSDIDRNTEFDNCIIIKKLEDCCSLFLHNDRDIINQICKKNESSKIQTESTITNNDESSMSTMVPFATTKPIISENSVLNVKVRIAKLSRPLFKGNDVLVTTGNTSIHVGKHYHSKSKRSYIDLWYKHKLHGIASRSIPSNLNLNDRHEYSENDYNNKGVNPKILSDYSKVYEQDYPYNYMNDYSPKALPTENHHYVDYYYTKKRNGGNVYDNPIELPSLRKEEESADRHNSDLANKNKQSQANANPFELQLNQRNSLSASYYPQQCIPYTPQVGSQLPILQPPQIPPYPFDSTAKLNSFLPMPRTPANSFVLNPQYPYGAPTYSSQLPGAYPSYPYNPYYWNQNVQTPQGQYYLCNPVPVSGGTTQHLTNMPGVEVRHSSISEKPVEEIKYNNLTRISLNV